MLAQTPAMVAPQDYNRIVSELQALQGIKNLSNLRVHETDAGKVSALEQAQRKAILFVDI